MAMRVSVMGLLLIGALVVLVIAGVVGVAMASGRGRGDRAPKPGVFPCPACGTEVPLSAKTCSQCGRSL